MLQPVLPIVSESMAGSLKRLGFSDATLFCYKEGVLTEYQEDSVPAPSFQEVQAWIGRRKRLDVLVYREVFFTYGIQLCLDYGSDSIVLAEKRLILDIEVLTQKSLQRDRTGIEQYRG